MREATRATASTKSCKTTRNGVRIILRSRHFSCGAAIFFSSRRRHTRFACDWSSEVCSSDLPPGEPPRPQGQGARRDGAAVGKVLIPALDRQMANGSDAGGVRKDGARVPHERRARTPQSRGASRGGEARPGTASGLGAEERHRNNVAEKRREKTSRNIVSHGYVVPRRRFPTSLRDGSP